MYIPACLLIGIAPGPIDMAPVLKARIPGQLEVRQSNPLSVF